MAELSIRFSEKENTLQLVCDEGKTIRIYDLSQNDVFELMGSLTEHQLKKYRQYTKLINADAVISMMRNDLHSYECYESKEIADAARAFLCEDIDTQRSLASRFLWEADKRYHNMGEERHMACQLIIGHYAGHSVLPPHFKPIDAD